MNWIELIKRRKKTEFKECGRRNIDDDDDDAFDDADDKQKYIIIRPK